MTQNDDKQAPAGAIPVGDLDAARALCTRALEEAQAAVEEHLRRAEELHRSAVATAHEILDQAPKADWLLTSIEQSTGSGGVRLDAPGTDLAQDLSGPLAAMDALIEQRRVSLDATMQHIMRYVQSQPPGPVAGWRTRSAGD